MKTEPVKLQFSESDIHDIDLFAHGQVNYKYLDVVPMPDGKTLAGMFPRGSKVKIPEGEEGRTFIKMWYWIWSKYERIINSLTAQFEYNISEEIKPYDLESKINKDGTIAVVELDGVPVLTSYNATKKNVYGYPLAIKIDYPNSHYDEQEFKEGEFVIIQNQPNGRSTFNDIIQYLEGEYAVIEGLRLNLQTSQPKGIFLMKAMIEENGKLRPIEMSLNAIAKGNKTFYTLAMSKDQLQGKNVQSRITEIQGTKESDFFIPIEFTDRTDNLIKNQQFWDNLINEAVGLNVNLAYEKKERVLGAEIESQNTISNGILRTKLACREEACKQVKKVFGWDWSVKLCENEAVEMSQEQQENGKTTYINPKRKGLFNRKESNGK